MLLKSSLAHGVLINYKKFTMCVGSITRMDGKRRKLYGAVADLQSPI